MDHSVEVQVAGHSESQPSQPVPQSPTIAQLAFVVERSIAAVNINTENIARLNERVSALEGAIGDPAVFQTLLKEITTAQARMVEVLEPLVHGQCRLDNRMRKLEGDSATEQPDDGFSPHSLMDRIRAMGGCQAVESMDSECAEGAVDGGDCVEDETDDHSDCLAEVETV